MNAEQKVYLASDFHLGLDFLSNSREREQKICKWLGIISSEGIGILHLVGDVFDYWFEYREVIPKGFTRLLGQLAKMSDDGWEIHYYTGNHDMWVFSYFQSELGIKVHYSPQYYTYFGKKYMIGHGDGLGKGDHAYKMIKAIFGSKICQRLFERIHPNTGISLMKWISKRGRLKHKEHEPLEDLSKEILIQYVEIESESGIDYFVFGHRHFPSIYLTKNKKVRYYNLGDWFQYNTYLVIKGEVPSLLSFEGKSEVVKINLG